jgi:hypothetical protein
VYVEQEMLAPVTHILPSVTIRQKRLLPAPGKVLVRRGQKVQAGDVIAQVYLSPAHTTLDLVRGLGLSPKEASRAVQRGVGEKVSQGDIIAGPVGLARRVVRAPGAGRILQVAQGKVFFEVEPPPFELKAGFPGIVESIVEDRGIVLKTTGAFVQGVWGNGQVGSGPLRVQASRPEDVMVRERLDSNLVGSIVLAGYCDDETALRAASQLPLGGLILSSMTSSLIPLALEIPFPIVITEGFGLLPMNSAAYTLASQHDRQEVSLLAEPYDRYAGTRPAIMISTAAEDPVDLPDERVFFHPGSRVRVIRAPHRSQIGTLIALRRGIDILSNGIRAATGEIRLQNGTRVVLPLANLEVLE